MWLIILSTLLCCYITLSYILMRFPQLIHRTKPLGYVPVHISHRGGAGERMENTMDAFQNAVSLGTDMLELDCHLTKDGQVVVLHDSNLKRITGVDLEVGTLDFDQLPMYLSKVEVEYHPGNYCKASAPTSRQFARLEEMFEAFPNILMNIDVKQNDDRLIKRVAELVREFRREDLTVWGSFWAEVAVKLKQANPKVKCFFPLKPVLWIFAGYFFGFLPFMSLCYDYMELPLVCAFNYPQFRQSYSLQSFKSRAIMWFLDKLLMSPKLYRHLNARGIPVIFWVCNTTKDFHTAFKMGAQGVITDYPRRLKTFLRNNPAYCKGSCHQPSELEHKRVASTQLACDWSKPCLSCSTHSVQLHLSESVSAPCPEWRSK